MDTSRRSVKEKVSLLTLLLFVVHIIEDYSQIEHVADCWRHNIMYVVIIQYVSLETIIGNCG